jgi:hypothetical protein
VRDFRRASNVYNSTDVVLLSYQLSATTTTGESNLKNDRNQKYRMKEGLSTLLKLNTEIPSPQI